MKTTALKPRSSNSEKSLQAAASKSQFADTMAKLAKEGARIAKAKYKAAREAFKKAKKLAKKAAKRAKRARREHEACLTHRSSKPAAASKKRTPSKRTVRKVSPPKRKPRLAKIERPPSIPPVVEHPVAQPVPAAEVPGSSS